MARLDSVADVRLGRQRSPKDHQGQDMRPYLRAANVTWRGVDLSHVLRMNFTSAELAVFRLESGDILVNEASGSPSEVGKAAMFHGEIDDCAFQNTIIRVRPLTVSGRYLLHFLTNRALSGVYIRGSRGVGINHIGVTGMAATITPIPSPEEQHQIVDVLEDNLSRIDVAISALRSAQVRASQFRRSLLHAAFSGALSEATGSALETVTIDDLVEVLIDHRGKTPAKLGGAFTTSGIRVISAIHIKGGQVDYQQRDRFVTTEMYRKWMPVPVRRGDLLLTSEAPLGATAMIETDEPLVLSQRLFALRARPELMRTDLLRHFLDSPDGRDQLTRRSSGTTVTGIRQSELRRIQVPLPDRTEQNRLVALLDAQLGAVEHLLEVTNTQIRRANALRRSLLQAAFTGELTQTWREKHCG